MKLKHKFYDQIAGITWSLWKELGVSSTNRFHQNCLVQIEELILLTMIIIEDDPRLRDEVLDWSSRYHELVSISRLRTLLKTTNSHTQHSFSQFAALLNSISSAKWPTNTEKVHFKAKVSKKSLLPPLESPSLLSLRLRSMFSPGAKADILSSFLTKNAISSSASDLVEIGYSKRSLMTALDHLAAAGIISAKTVRNKKQYELNRLKELQVLIGKLPEFAPPWSRILQVVNAIDSVIPELQNLSDSSKNILFRNCLIKLEPILPTFISPILDTKPEFEQDWDAIMKMLNAFKQGNFSGQFCVYNEFDKIIVNLLHKLYQLDDCIDGIEMIFDKIDFKQDLHMKLYKECYQLFLTFTGDLKVKVKQFLDFPFHKIVDEPLADIPYQYSKEKLPKLLEELNKIKPISEITRAQLANRQYQMFMPIFDELRQFIYSFRKRLEELYFIKTDIHLLSSPSTLYKRHLVLALFSTKP